MSRHEPVCSRPMNTAYRRRMQPLPHDRRISGAGSAIWPPAVPSDIITVLLSIPRQTADSFNVINVILLSVNREWSLFGP